MAVTPINSFLRISGISSGLDTESMVTSLMQVEKIKVNRVAQQKVMLEWRKEAQRDIHKQIQSFRETTMSVLSPATNLYTASAFKTHIVSMAQATDAVTVTAGTNALAGSRTIDHIDQLASAARVSGTLSLTGGTGIPAGAKLSDVVDTLGLTFGGEDLDTLSFEINGEAFTFKDTATLSSVFNTISTSNAGVTIAYTELSDQVIMSTKATGAAQAIAITNTEGNFFGAASALGITGASYQNGTDAALSIDGITVTRASNTFTIDGATYALKSTTPSAIAFQVTRDIEPASARIKSFVTLYNQLVGSLQDTIAQEKFEDYTPLTDEQRADMSETEIEKWETKAKSGMFRHDRDLTSLLSKMRGMLYETVQGAGLSLSDIGIKTGLYFDGGKVVLDEAKLSAALTKDPDAVMNLFTQSAPAGADPALGTATGFLPRLLQAFSSYTSKFSTAKADADIAVLGKRISEMNSQLSIRETQYWKRFSSMEEALSTMQSQSDWLTQQLSY